MTPYVSIIPDMFDVTQKSQQPTQHIFSNMVGSADATNTFISSALSIMQVRAGPWIGCEDFSC